MNDTTQGGTGKEETGNSMWRWLCVEPTLTAMNRGPVLRQTLSILVQLGAILIGIRLFIDWCRMWPVIKNMSFVEGLGFALFLLGLLYAGFLALQAMFIRGGNVRELTESEYVIAPIVGLLAAMLGEMAFVFFGIMSVSAMIGVWCDTAAVSVLPVLWQWRSGNAFLNGLSMFLSCWVTGLLSLVITRWLKEWPLAVIQIAQDVRAIRSQ